MIKLKCLLCNFISISFLFALLLPVNSIFAADWTQTFVEGVNSYSTNGSIGFYAQGKLYNSPQNGNLPSYSVRETNKSCVPAGTNRAKKCKSGGYLAVLPSDRLPFAQCQSSSNSRIGPPSSSTPEILVPEGEYGDVQLSGGSDKKLTFSTVDGVYKLKSLNAISGTLELAAGQYWIGSLSIARDVTVRFPTTGSVSFFVRDSYIHRNSTLSYRAERFLLYGYSNVDLENTGYLRGYLVSEGRIRLFDTATVEGGITSNNIEIDNNSRVIFENTAGSIDVVPDCDVETLLPAIPLQCPAEQNSIAGITYRTYDSTTWKPGQYTSPVDHDDFNDLITTVKKTTQQLGESIEPQVEGYGSSINPHSSQGDNYVGIFEGYITAPESGLYTFGIDGDDAIELLIDDQVVVGFYGLHGQCGWPCETGKIGLAAGTHKVEMRFHEATGAEAYHLYWQLPSANNLVKVPSSAYLTCPFPQFEFGRATLDSKGQASITFNNSYASPPVVMLMPTINGIDGSEVSSDGPATASVSSITSANAMVYQQIPPGNRVSAKAMTEIDYFVMEPGYRFLNRGAALQAGKVDTRLYQGSQLPSSGRGYTGVDFNHNFGTKPAMIGQALSRNNNRFITTVINNVASAGTGFDIAIEASEISLGINSDETLGYVAGLGRGSTLVSGAQVLYEFGYALNHGNGNSVRSLAQQCSYTNNYLNTYPGQPITLANKNTRKGGDGGWIRRCLKDSYTGVMSFGLDEDQYRDNDRSHLAEDIGYFAFERQPDPVLIDHYRIEFTSGALSCAAKAITLRACVNNDCSSESSVQSSVELTKNSSKYSDVVISSATQTQLWHADGGSVLLGLGATAPSATYRCFIDGAEVANSQCLLNFEDTGFYFDAPNTLSCKNGASFNLYAVTKNTQTQKCQPLFANQTKAINFSFDYERPSPVNNPAKLTLNSLLAPTATTEIDGGSTNSMDVHFNALGVATLSANYPEAGVVRLTAEHLHRIDLPTGGSDTLTLSHSDTFTAAPAGFHFFNGSGNKRCDASDPYDANCGVLAAAGGSFNMQVKAACWQSDSDSDFSDNGALQNFVYPGFGLRSQVVEPSSGSDGSLGQASIDFTLSGSATALSIEDQSWNEVGTMKVGLSSALSYEGVTIDINKSSSEVFGRFTPAYLGVTGNSPEITHSCGAFTYMDQPFTFKTGVEPRVQVVGYSASNGVTANYQEGLWWRYQHRDASQRNGWGGRQYLDTSTKAVVADSQAPALSGAVNYLNTPNVAELIGARINYLRTPTPVVPFDAKFDLTLSVADVSDEDGICYQDDAAGNCRSFTFTDIADGDGFALRYGRLVLENGYGPESESLRLPLRTEYVSSLSASAEAIWATNTMDNCSIYNTQTSADASEAPSTGLFMLPPSGFPAINAYSNPSLTLQSGSLSLGNGYSYFSVPNAAGEMPLKQHVEPWLKWYWNFDGITPTTLYDPRANAYFGTYRGHDKIIYWREVR
ncbi:DUF6701 domain-containing protein [Shewanella colwelliana]|uniref:DUF6701 domain-containing protein n=1 Tax=Shewanella colwelliana TaxID=23 RepID=UPI003D031693